MSPQQWKRPPLPEETFTDRFGEGEGELLTLAYPKPLPMRLDRWLVSQRTEQSRARIQKFIDAGYVRVNGKTGKAKTPCARAMRCSCGCRRRNHCLTSSRSRWIWMCCLRMTI